MPVFELHAGKVTAKSVWEPQTTSGSPIEKAGISLPYTFCEKLALLSRSK